jgi:uncharacterized RDD family membrane protein YckC
VTGPDDFFAKNPPTPPPADQGGYGQPGYGQPPAGAPGYGQPPYGAPPAYGQPAGAPFGQPGGPVLASWLNRAGATLLDGILATGVAIPFYVLGAVLTGGGSEGLGGLMVALAYVAQLAFIIWQLVVQGQTGQTIGKKVQKLRLLREQDGQVIGAGLSVGRYILHIVDYLPCFVGFLWPLWDKKRQTFADKIVKTVVIKA